MRWLRKREKKLLPVRHYHTIFSVSHAFNDLWRHNPQVLGDLLFASGVGSLRTMLADPRWLGAEVGLTVTLETWNDLLLLHPHLHCLVTGGGLTPDGQWRDVPNPKCLIAVKPLMWEFRKRFCRGLKQLLQDGQLTLPKDTTTRHWLQLLNKENRKKWSVFISKQPEEGGPTPADILRYQSHDVAGGPLSGDRLIPEPTSLSVSQLAFLKSMPINETRLLDTSANTSEGQVSFCWGKYDPDTGKRERSQIETLPADRFLQRYLQHVPPHKYQTVRHYGLYTSSRKAAYQQCRLLLADRQLPASDEADGEDAPDNEAWIAEHTCPICAEPLVVARHLPSTLTGRITPRPPLGPVKIRPPT